VKRVKVPESRVCMIRLGLRYLMTLGVCMQGQGCLIAVDAKPKTLHPKPLHAGTRMPYRR
jgi:hypothetical protein